MKFQTGPCPLGPKEIDGVLVHPDKAYMLKSEPAQEKWFQVKPPIHTSLISLVRWLYLKHFLDVMMFLNLGTSPIKWRQRPDMTIAVGH